MTIKGSLLKMTRIIQYVFMLAVLFFTAPVMACAIATCCPSNAIATTYIQREFMISAVLRLHSDGMTIKLLHTFRTAQSSDEALGKFTRDVLDEYPGYGILSTLISEVTSGEKAKVCGLGA